MNGPIVFRIPARTAVVQRVSHALCQRFGCSWEERRGYDWCARCGASAWHIARQHAPAA